MLPVDALWFPATSWVALPSPDDAAVLGALAVAGQKVAQRTLPYIDDAGRRLAPYADYIGHRMAPYIDETGRIIGEVGQKTSFVVDRAGKVASDAGPLVARAADSGRHLVDDGLRLAGDISGIAGNAARRHGQSLKQIVVGQSDDVVVTAAAYSRQAFGWSPSTRTRLLRGMSTNTVVENAGRITHGRWHNDYTGEIMTSAAEVAIDHVIPLHLAWENGAADWTAEQRAAFANDPLNLRVTDHATNSVKGSKGLDGWSPEEPSLKRQYELRFRAVARKYGLKLAKAL